MQSPNPSPSPMPGKAMLAIAWIIGLLLLTQMFGWWEDRQINPNQRVSLTQDSLGELVLQRNRFGHYVFTARVNGQPVEFLVDTGATLVALPASLARELNLPSIGKTYVETANGVTEATRTRIDTLTMGPFELRNVDATYLQGLELEGGRRQGLLGMSALRHFSFAQDGNRLILRPN